jgi:hypothetical protein
MMFSLFIHTSIVFSLCGTIFFSLNTNFKMESPVILYHIRELISKGFSSGVSSKIEQEH